MERDRDRVTDGEERAARRGVDAAPGGDVTVDELSAASFPASDPPATWTWEIPADPAEADEHGDAMRPGITVRDDAQRGRFEARVGSALAGYADYDLQPGLLTILHTEVDNAFEGRGVGSELVRRIVEDVRARKLKVLPICPFARAFLERHPAYGDLVWKP
jgi:predicted GNAT family acetyltransferase